MFFLLLGIYLMGHPGRIDVIDGQLRYEVSRNLLNGDGPVVSEPYIAAGKLPTNKLTGKKYAYYSAPPSIVSLLPMAVGRVIRAHSDPSDRFWFAITSAFIGAIIGPLLLAFYRRLGVSLVPAIGWSLMFALATLWWPSSETTFDQCQHGVLMFAVMIFGYDAAQSGALRWAAVTGLLGGLLIDYRTPYAALLVVIPVYWWFELRAKKSPDAVGPVQVIKMTALFMGGLALGFVAYVGFNYVRFGQSGMPSFATEDALGNPIHGFLILIVSPGKGVLWFSPPLVMAIFGLPRMWKAQPRLTKLILAISAIHIGLMSMLIFAGGDWCWGPRYLITVMPLWALAFPFVSAKFATRFIVSAFAVVGIGVQLLALSVDHDRFFWERRFSPDMSPDLLHYSWQFYFHNSQLSSRLSELITNAKDSQKRFPKVNFNPYNDATYVSSGPIIVDILPRLRRVISKGPPPVLGMTKDEYAVSIFKNVNRFFVRQESENLIYFAARPWWGWIDRVPESQKPINPTGFLLLCIVVTGAGGYLLRSAVTKRDGLIVSNVV